MQDLPIKESQEDSMVINPPGFILEERDSNKHTHAHHFIQWDRETQFKAFFDWLPVELHDMPGIEWTHLPPKVMGYCVRTVGSSPDAVYIAIAVASAFGAINDYTLLRIVGELNKLFRTLRSQCN